MTKVLLVEDNEMNRDMLSRRLIRRGFQVVFALDGQQGIDLARSDRPDIILMDMSLPVIDGWEATRRLKSDDATRSVPVIGLTAHAMSGDREKAIEAGCDDYDTKPVELDRLIGKIERLLGNAKDEALRQAVLEPVCRRLSGKRGAPVPCSGHASLPSSPLVSPCVKTAESVAFALGALILAGSKLNATARRNHSEPPDK
jgi:two-component system cell cycle response regulator DivK